MQLRPAIILTMAHTEARAKVTAKVTAKERQETRGQREKTLQSQRLPLSFFYIQSNEMVHSRITTDTVITLWTVE